MRRLEGPSGSEGQGGSQSHGQGRRGKKSLSLSGWERLRRVCAALRETEASVGRLRAEVDGAMASQESVAQRQGKVEAQRVWVGLLERELEASRRLVLRGKGRLTAARVRREQAVGDNGRLAEEVGEWSGALGERRAAYVQEREALLRASAQLASRRRQLADELADVFVLTAQPKAFVSAAAPAKGRRSEDCACAVVHRILGAHVPAAESYAGHSEAELGVGLGRVAHAVQVLSQLLDLPLRFPLHLLGSSSSVSNLIAAGFHPSERRVPLHGRGQEAESFGYAVYLLNRDLGQLRMDLGLPTPDLRPTLPNLSGLFAHLRALKISMPLGPVSGSGSGRSPLPSSLGEEEGEDSATTSSSGGPAFRAQRPGDTQQSRAEEDADKTQTLRASQAHTLHPSPARLNGNAAPSLPSPNS